MGKLAISLPSRRARRTTLSGTMTMEYGERALEGLAHFRRNQSFKLLLCSSERLISASRAAVDLGIRRKASCGTRNCDRRHCGIAPMRSWICDTDSPPEGFMSGNRPEVVSQQSPSRFKAEDVGAWLAAAIACFAVVAMLVGVASFLFGPVQ